MAASGVAMRTHDEARIATRQADLGEPSPMKRTARLALDSLRVTTAPIFQPNSRIRRPSARPTRPAPTIASVVLHLMLG